MVRLQACKISGRNCAHAGRGLGADQATTDNPIFEVINSLIQLLY